MAKLNHSSTLSIGGKLAGSWNATVATISGDTGKITKKIGGLTTAQRGLSTSLRQAESAAAAFGVKGSQAVADLTIKHKGLVGQQKAVEAELAKAQRAAAKLGKSGSADIERLLHESQRLEREVEDVAGELSDARRAAKRLGVEGSHDVAKLRGEHAKLNDELDREKYKLKRIKALHDIDAGGRVSKALGSIGGGFATVGRHALYAGAAVGGIGAAAIGWFTKSSIEATAGLETLETALTTLEGSSEKAGKAVDWIVTFSDKTPYTLDQVGEAFNRLRSYGLEPTNGLLETLGDTSAAMGKPLMQSVEAISDALTGQNERLKEFGIRSEVAGSKITYFYKNAAGKDAKKTVNKNSQDMIQATLSAIWNEKYAGSMEKQSRTWSGLMSTLASKWTLFQVRVMRSGVFDTLKDQLGGLIDNANKWAQDGTLERWANQIADAYKWAFGRVREGFTYVRDHWPEIKQGFSEFWETSKQVGSGLMTVGGWLLKIGTWASDAVGGPKNLAIALAAVGAAKVLSPLGSVVGVLVDIAGWAMKSKTATDLLGKSMSGIGGAAKGAGGMLGKGAGALGRGAAVAGRFAGPAAAVLGAGALGYYGTKGILKATGGEKKIEQAGAAAGRSEGFNAFMLATGRALGIDSLIEAAKANQKRNKLDGLSAGPTKSTTVTHQDNRRIEVRVDAKSADAREVAREVERVLSDKMRGEALAGYG